MTSATDPWDVIGYEVQMYFAMRAVLTLRPAFLADRLVENAVVESLGFHARILSEVFISTLPGERTQPDDIQFSDLFLDWSTNQSRYTRLLGLSVKLQQSYGLKNPSPGQPRWEFNKMLAHPTLKRGTTYDYSQAVYTIHPHILEIVEALEQLKAPGFRFAR
jgi:hypothetical protein